MWFCFECHGRVWLKFSSFGHDVVVVTAMAMTDALICSSPTVKLLMNVDGKWIGKQSDKGQSDVRTVS